MRTSKISIRIAVLATALALIAGPQLPALAAPASTPTITIAASSKLPVVTGFVAVIFRHRGLRSAKISGDITGAADGQVVRLFAQQFPFKKAPAPIGTPIMISQPGTSTPYSFMATPTLATRYTVELFADSSTTTPLATSSVVTVYVIGNGFVSGGRKCGRPTCHQKFRLQVTVPASTLKTEIRKRWFVYFGLRFSSRGTLLPKTLRLGAGHVHVSAPRKLNSREFAVTLTFTFFIGRHGYNFVFFPCQRDTESKDGLNLPGHHGCGTLKSVSIHRIYLG